MGRTAGLGVGGAGCIAFALLFIAGQPALAYTALIIGLLGLSLSSVVSLNWQILIGAGLGAAFGAVEGRSALEDEQ